MHTDYKSESIRQLRDQQVRFAPREKKLEQICRAEKLISELDRNRTYSYEYLCFRITQFRPEVSGLLTLSGTDAVHDIGHFIQDVSEAADLRVDEMVEPVRSVDELSEQLSVSTKTISRWRQQGLVSRKFIFELLTEQHRSLHFKEPIQGQAWRTIHTTVRCGEGRHS